MQERRQWKRFGEAVTESADDNYTVQAVEEIPFERIQKQKQTQAEKKEAADLKSALAGTDKQAIVGRCVIGAALQACSTFQGWLAELHLLWMLVWGKNAPIFSEFCHEATYNIHQA